MELEVVSLIVTSSFFKGICDFCHSHFRVCGSKDPDTQIVNAFTRRDSKDLLHFQQCLPSRYFGLLMAKN